MVTPHRRPASICRCSTRPPERIDGPTICWRDERGRSARSPGEKHLTGRHVRRVMRLAFLAPRIVEAIVEGYQPADLSTIAMTQRIELPPLWSAQQQALESR